MEQSRSVPADPREWYVEQLDVINRISQSLCRRNGVRDADAEDFAADVRLKLLQDDYAVLRKFRGGSSTTTFLTVVISNLFRDFRIKQWGRWRPSAEAKRRGELALVLEALVYRDGLAFDQACRILEESGRLKIDRGELRKLMSELPYRSARRSHDDIPNIDDVPASDTADEGVLDGEREERLRAAKAALDRGINRLEPEDRILVRLHYFEGLSIADVARATGVPQQPLYARLKRLWLVLSTDLVSQGIGPEDCDWLNSAPP